MPAADTLLIMPTVRDYGVLREYFANADLHRFPRERLEVLLVTEDHCDQAAMRRFLRDEGVHGEVLGAAGRRAWLEERKAGRHEALIPRRSHAETSFGLLYMWHHGHPYGIFIDDDTTPVADDYFGLHRSNLLEPRERPRVSSDTGWVNVLHQNGGRLGLHPRGHPYGKMGGRHTTRRARGGPVVASQGLWTHVADLDAVRILMGGDLDGRGRPFTEERDVPESFVVEHGQQTTVCSMNLAFKREAIPAFYQFPMDDNEWKVGRFDDIWSGFCLKHVADAKGVDLVHGRPLCRHDKAPRSTFKDLVAEANGLELNEHFTEFLPPIEPKAEWGEAYRAMGAALQRADASRLVNGAFLAHCGRLMEQWVEAVESLG
jgi:hypothetical protein